MHRKAKQISRDYLDLLVIPHCAVIIGVVVDVVVGVIVGVVFGVIISVVDIAIRFPLDLAVYISLPFLWIHGCGLSGGLIGGLIGGLLYFSAIFAGSLLDMESSSFVVSVMPPLA
ncbi:hypothetical protein C2G38_2187185 [Gigaspora rosea]|uniref:Uncharacterized protein n=1 Tax=Gigaspora rosea TaxID=44941 RepID=A0A397VDV2_9GLOM|nr:hypothetical protein C2G38_2187185 [Gigaspora rosea]